MAFADNLPLSESFGVFVGVAGFDWLADGNAEPLTAALAALSAGAVLLVARHWLRKKQQD